MTVHKAGTLDVSGKGSSAAAKTAKGQSRPSRSSFKHGLYSQQLVLSHEDPAKLDRLRADLRAEHQPVNTTEEILVNELAEQYWRLRRFRAYEVAAWNTGHDALLLQLQRGMAAAERGLNKALATLRQLQKDRGFVPAISKEPVVEAGETAEPETEEQVKANGDPEANSEPEQPSSRTENPSHPAPPPPIDYAEQLRRRIRAMVGFDSEKNGEQLDFEEAA